MYNINKVNVLKFVFISITSELKNNKNVNFERVLNYYHTYPGKLV